jgi:NADH-quinone oxidoreductase subunit L
MPEDQRVLEHSVYTWIEAGDDFVAEDGTAVTGGTFSVDVGFLADPLSGIMMLVVLGVGFLIHVYSTGYMAHDAGYARFFCYLNLFTFAMLLLVMGNNIFVLFVGWEGVGFCSYALISFWYKEMPNAWAGMKAFVVNRIGDFGFIIGFMLLFWTLGSQGVWTMNFRELAASAHLLEGLQWGGINVVTWIALFMFVGACGKSAQLPLYVWLPDAMAGPTPVSALIHAATMVTAGVYMVTRMNFLYTMSPFALDVVATIGVCTALFAATIGLAQNDIKKVLAYSTVSQLGYMFLALGVGAFSAGVFHLMTHAFFKGLLFLGAGSVIHAMSDEQDMRRMGGLWKKIPWTFGTFAVATIAICGIYPFAGFFSKDEILWKAWEGGYKLHWVLGFAAAGMTAFYMTRLVAMTFFGKNRSTEEQRHHLHESPWNMIAPLVVLAVLSLAGGWVGVPAALGGHNHFHHWLAPVTEGGHGHDAGHHLVAAAHDAHGDEHHAADSHAAPVAHHGEAGHDDHAAHVMMERTLAGVSVLLALSSVGLGLFVYLKRTDIAEKAAAFMGGLPHRLLENKYFVDEIYDWAVVQNVLRLTRWMANFDQWVIDGIVNGVAIVTRGVATVNGFIDKLFVDGAVNLVGNALIFGGNRLRRLQTGQIQQYLYVLGAGVTIIVLIGLFVF